MSFRSPPLTSGIVVLSGSYGFDAVLSDYPVPAGLVRASQPSEVFLPEPRALNFVGPPDDMNITVGTSTVLTSGIVIWEWAVGAGEPYVIPLVYNARIFPISTAVFPSTVSGLETTVSGERVFPLLPQYSTIIP